MPLRHRVPCFLLWGGLLAGAILSSACGGGGGAEDAEDGDASIPIFRAASLVFGQTGFTGHLGNRGRIQPGADSMNGPGLPGPDPTGGGLLYLPDIGNNRVLGFDVAPVFNNLSAHFVLGQPGFAFRDPNVGLSALDAPICAVLHAGRLYVSDYGNDRVAIWHGLPLSNAAPLTCVLGQPNAGTKGSRTTRGGMDGPLGIALAGNRVLVADSGNNRILIWNSLPEGDGAPADLVLGQADFVSGLPNRAGPPRADTLRNPTSVWTDGERVAVVDNGNHRVLIWLTFPLTSGTPADLVLGQGDLASGLIGAGQAGLRSPSDIWSDGERLLIADGGNHRILIWNIFPTASATPADGILGQSDFDHTAPNDDDQDGFPDAIPSQRTFFSGATGLLSVRMAAGRIFVGDAGNHRVLIFDEW